MEFIAIAHNGCQIFARRFGSGALRFVNSQLGKQLSLRGSCVRGVRDGMTWVGGALVKC